MKASLYLNTEEFHELMVQAVKMYLAGENERKVKGPEYDGRLYTEQRYELIGTMGGQRFDADLDTSRGHDHASFLVNEQTQGAGAAISLN